MFEVDVKNMMDEKEKKNQVRFWVLIIINFFNKYTNNCFLRVR